MSASCATLPDYAENLTLVMSERLVVFSFLELYKNVINNIINSDSLVTVMNRTAAALRPLLLWVASLGFIWTRRLLMP